MSEPAAARRKDVAVVLLLHSQLVSGSPGDLRSLVVQPYLTFPTASANSSMVIGAAAAVVCDLGYSQQLLKQQMCRHHNDEPPEHGVKRQAEHSIPFLCLCSGSRPDTRVALLTQKNKAPLSKSLLLVPSAISILLTLLFQHYQKFFAYNLQAIKEDFQIWRLVCGRAICLDLKDTFCSSLLIYNFRIFERRYGSRKFSSFLLGAWMLSALFDLLLVEIAQYAFGVTISSLPSGLLQFGSLATDEIVNNDERRDPNLAVMRQDPGTETHLRAAALVPTVFEQFIKGTEFSLTILDVESYYASAPAIQHFAADLLHHSTTENRGADARTSETQFLINVVKLSLMIDNETRNSSQHPTAGPAACVQADGSLLPRDSRKPGAASTPWQEKRPPRASHPAEQMRQRKD
ncbi:Ubiquitin-associated domain-containing protein 2 isoform X2 [Aix galericulata]|nr:Ubiquitin-associated domain-containing protein 2 isoform X2 [Aix galericulata]